MGNSTSIGTYKLGLKRQYFGTIFSAITIAIRKGVSGETHWLTTALSMDSWRTGGNATGWTVQPDYSAGSDFRKGLRFFSKTQSMFYEYGNSIEILGGTMSTPFRLCVVYWKEAAQNKAPYASLEKYIDSGDYTPPTQEAVNKELVG